MVLILAATGFPRVRAAFDPCRCDITYNSLVFSPRSVAADSAVRTVEPTGHLQYRTNTTRTMEDRLQAVDSQININSEAVILELV